MQTFLEWLHWIRLIAHRHPNGPAWIQGVGSLLAVLAAVWIFWRQGRAREKERREDNRIRQEREAEDNRIRREREEKDDRIRRRLELNASFERRQSDMRLARIASEERRVRQRTLLIIVWPLIVQTRNRMALVLTNNRRAMLNPSIALNRTGPSFYLNYTVGVTSDWERVDREVFIFGNDIAVAIHEMLAIVRQNDKDIDQLAKSNGSIDFKMHSDFLRNAKEYADRAQSLLGLEYEKSLGKPKRAVFWARGAKAVASQAEKRKKALLEPEIETESESSP